jgi:hypothetical protein
MNNFHYSHYLVACLLSVFVSACTQMPTERQSVSDIRPLLSFKTVNEGMHNARVIVDGLDMGVVGNYLDGASALRLLSGVHVVRIVLDGRVVFDEKFYMGDGVNRSILVK